MSEAIEYALPENGLDYIWSAVEHLRGAPARRDLKYAVLHLGAGVELVLKERLRRHDPTLLLRDPSQFDPADFEAGDFRSASVFATIKRLAENAEVVISDEHRETVLALREKRNRLEHFGIVDTRDALIASTARTLDFLLDFIDQELGSGTLTEEAGLYLSQIREALPELVGFVQERWKRIEPDIQDASTAVVKCAKCGEAAAVLDDGSHCLFCGDYTAAEQAADDYAHEVLGASHYRAVHDGDGWIVETCPSCERDAHVHQGTGWPAREDAAWVCFSCGESWSTEAIESCAKCGQPVDVTDDSMGVCSVCWEATLARSD